MKNHNIFLRLAKSNKNFYFNTGKTSRFNTKSSFMYSTKKHNTNFDYNLDWLFNKLFTDHFTIVKSLLVLNAGIFLFSWLRPSEVGRYEAKSKVSFSTINMKNRDYSNLFCSMMGSRRVEDFVFDSTVLLTIGRYLEKTHGTPFIFKVFIFSFYLGFLNSVFWVNSKYARRERYVLNDPYQREKKYKELQEVKFSSMHGFTMSLVYFYLFKRMRIMVLPALVADYVVWGPYYLTGVMNGLAWGIIV